MADTDALEEDDIWNYKRRVSRKRELPSQMKKSKPLNCENETCSSKAENNIIPIIDLDEEEDLPFKNSLLISNNQSRKQWASLFSKPPKSNGDESDIKNVKNKKPRNRKRNHTPSKSPMKDIAKKSTVKKNCVFGSKTNEKVTVCESFIQHFSPRKVTPEKGNASEFDNYISCSSDENEETTKVECSSASVAKCDSAFKNSITEEPKNVSSSNPEEGMHQSSNWLLGSKDSSVVGNSVIGTEVKVVDVIVVDDDNDVNDNLSKESCDSSTKAMVESASKGMIDDQNIGGGFLRSDDESEEETESLKKESSPLIPECSKSPFLKDNLSDESLDLPDLHPTSTSCVDDGVKYSNESTSAALPFTAARKQTSLLSFFSSKSSSMPPKPKNKNAMGQQNSHHMGDSHPTLTKSTTFPPGNSTGRYQRPFGRSNNISGISENTPDTNSTDVKPRGRQRQCPFYKKIPGTNITVDAFRYGVIPGCNVYFLTHFHYDHYGGLTKKFAQPIYCSEVTGNLVERRLGVAKQWIHRLPMWKPIVVDGVTLTLMEANHCPGAVIVLFETSNGKKILHTGDFRACPEMEEYPALKNIVVDELYLDTTYCNPSYAFPSQKTVIDFAVSLVEKQIAINPKTLIVCGAYTIGKERIFAAIAKKLESKICVMSDKKKVLDCLDDKDLKSRLTLNWSEGQVHVLPMAKLKQESLYEHHSRHPRFTSIMAFEPTGWTHSAKAVSLENLKPKWSRSGIVLYGVPYSEHSSYLELKRFVQFTNPRKILPTVNNGSPEARKKMENIFDSWLKEKAQLGKTNGEVTSQQSNLEDWMKNT